jgi:hypothetical protein
MDCEFGAYEGDFDGLNNFFEGDFSLMPDFRERDTDKVLFFGRVLNQFVYDQSL